MRWPCLAITIIAAAIYLVACNSTTSKSPAVAQHCTSCHLYPNPKSLTSDIWVNSVLPEMADYFSWNQTSTFPYANKPFYNKLNRLPMDDDTWIDIINFYKQYGLESAESSHIVIESQQNYFEEIPLSLAASNHEVTALHILGDSTILFGADKKLFTLSAEFKVIDSIQVGMDIMDIYEPHSDSIFIAGAVTINPHEAKDGRIMLYTDSLTTFVNDLQRPVQILRKGNDIIISEFGYRTGGLSIYSRDKGKRYIHNYPGSYKILKAQLTRSTKEPDLIMSLGQAHDGVYKIELGDKSMIPLIRFEPEFGISDLDVADINQDGFDDVLIVNGDNADYSIMPKAYHGVRVYLNRGDGTFDEDYFFPFHGATQGRFIDIDGDNYMDIVASAFFSEKPDQSIMVFKGQADNKYQVSTVSSSTQGKWMVMEKGDINSDGYEDVIIGSYLNGPMQEKNLQEPYDILVLLNKR